MYAGINVASRDNRETVSVVALALVSAAILVGLWQGDGLAALFGDETPVLVRVAYVLIGVALVIALISIFNNNFLTRILERLGNSSGDERGPKAGEGATTIPAKQTSMVHREASHLQARTPIAICHTRIKNLLIRLAPIYVFV